METTGFSAPLSTGGARRRPGRRGGAATARARCDRRLPARALGLRPPPAPSAPRTKRRKARGSSPRASRRGSRKPAWTFSLSLSLVFRARSLGPFAPRLEPAGAGRGNGEPARLPPTRAGAPGSWGHAGPLSPSLPFPAPALSLSRDSAPAPAALCPWLGYGPRLGPVSFETSPPLSPHAPPAAFEQSPAPRGP